MLIKYLTILLINTLLLLNSSAKANITYYVVGNTQDKITQRIDSFFIKHPNEKRVFWMPEIKGKSRYAFSIQKDAYLTSKKYADASDLYYLSEKIDKGLKFVPTKSKSIDIFVLKNNFYATYRQRLLLGINAGLFFQSKEQKSFGVILNKDVIISKSALGNFGIEQNEHKYIVFIAKFAKISNNENSEFYGNINHEFKTNTFNVDVGHTWFEIANQFDFTVGIQEQDKKVKLEFYSSFGDENVKFKIGLNQIKNNSNINIFFNLKFKNTLNSKKFGTNMIITSRDSVFGLRNISLKSFRKKNLDMLWRKHMKYN